MLTEQHVKMKVDMGVTKQKLKNVRNCQHPTRSQERDLEHVRGTNLATPSLWISRFQNRETRRVCCLKHPVCGTLLG